MVYHAGIMHPYLIRQHAARALLLAALAAMTISGRAAGADQKLPEPPKPDPKNPVDYIAWYNATFGAGITDDNNAALLYQKAYEKIEPMEDWHEVTFRPWSDDLTVIAWLDKNQEGLELFKHAARKRRCFFPLNAPENMPERFEQCLLGVPLPHLQLHREAARGLAAEAHRALAQGDASLAGTNALTLIHSGHQLTASGQLLEHLVGLSVAALGYELITNMLAGPDLPGPFATRMLNRLQDMDPAHPSPRKACLMERVSVLDFLQRYFVPADNGGYILHDLRGTGLEHVDFGLLGGTKLRSSGFPKIVSLAEDYFDKVDRWLECPSWEALRPEQMAVVEKARESDILTLAALLPSLTRSRGMYERVEATRQATHVILALHIYKHKEGRFPDSISELKLEVPAIDPYSGKPFRYRRTDDDFLLYSIGADFGDDGGRHSRSWGEGEDGGDYVFWPVPECP